MNRQRRVPRLLCLLLAALALAPATAGAQSNPYRIPDIHFVPTPHEVVEVMLRLADVGPGDVVYDLGCGDGRIVIAAAQRGARAFGFDIDPEMVKQARERVLQAGVGHRATIQEADVFELDLSQATVVTLYLLPELNVRLIPQFEKLRPGSRIVSHDFDMGGILPDVEATVQRRGHRTSLVYLWTTPLRRASDASSLPDKIPGVATGR